MTTEQREFQAETRQLLDLMVHSIYSNKDSFLRELISNSSDALDKLRLESYQNKDLDVDVSDLHIELDIDKQARTLTIRDNGIGMSRAEVIDLIGTLAKSGTAEVRKKLKEAKDAAASEELIGQFGIGFYSTFMVAEKVTLLTRRAGEATATKWESTGEGTYEISDVEDAPQGSSVTLHLKPADEEDHLHDYADERKVKELVKKYSDFIAWPIRIDVEKRVTSPKDENGEGGEETVTIETETVNSQKALWTRSKDEVSEEEYKEFYKHVSHAWDEPLEVIPFKAEGTFEYQALLFIPSQAPFDLFMREGKTGVHLYVKRVFIMDDCEELMPEYLRFVRGVVDAADLSLNVSREILQQDRQIRAIRRRLTRKVLATIKEMQAEQPEKYTTFWSQFGRAIKEGLISDSDNREALLALSSFSSTFSEEGVTTLAEYVDRMKDGQEQIYYMTGESRSQIESSPHMEAFKARGLEVLLLTDSVDEVWVGNVPDFDGKEFQSISKGEVDLDTEEEKKEAEAQREEQDKDFADLLTWMTETLGDDVKEVRLSSRLTTSPACVVGDEFSFSPQLEKMYKASGQFVPPSKRILELNPKHDLVTGLKKAREDRSEDPNLAETAELLYATALLAEGTELKDPAKFSRLLADRLTRTV
ncbi:molecular chaperone HtpG [Rhodococcus sp. 1163]|uniref:molecular chaperone HtpG n=1 Tax=unclassified Rhodococcus (in: high G+C Gram-positive bacteria) TaxID=192944 RepID=UPI000A078B02|nr:molecular chaperone HtpG [Rhodococcus sp. 1163]ORI13745.1 molecular chaperone HtpG [Rhodococcus sp. 1163]